MSKILLITKQLSKSPIGGRELLCKLNHDILKLIYKKDFKLLELIAEDKNILTKFSGIFKGYIDGVNSNSINHAKRIIGSEEINKVFVDGSNLGAISKSIKADFPDIEIITFFHNVEVRFFWGSFRNRAKIKSFAVLFANYIGERLSIKNSDQLICLSNRDSLLLQRLYGRGADHISPIAMEDKYKEFTPAVECEECEDFALFVGGDFYANTEGIKWYVKEVVPRINIKTYVVGRGFDLRRHELEIPNKVIVIGEVPNISKWYLCSKFVIAPIFDGSGMKTKIAEALMHGKKIVATSEAFSGYEDISESAGWICEDANQFVEAIQSASQMLMNRFDQEMRDIYLQGYSFKAALNRIKKITTNPNSN